MVNWYKTQHRLPWPSTNISSTLWLKSYRISLRQLSILFKYMKVSLPSTSHPSLNSKPRALNNSLKTSTAKDINVMECKMLKSLKEQLASPHHTNCQYYRGFYQLPGKPQLLVRYLSQTTHWPLATTAQSASYLWSPRLPSYVCQSSLPPSSMLVHSLSTPCSSASGPITLLKRPAASS